MKAGQDHSPDAAQIAAAFRAVFGSPAHIGKLIMVALGLIATFVVLPRFYWPGDFPAVWQAIGWLVVVGGTALVVMVMAADAAES